MPKKSASWVNPLPLKTRTRGPPPSSGEDGEVDFAVPVQIPGRDEDSAGEARFERIRAEQHVLIDAVEDDDMSRPARAGTGHQIGDAVAVEVPRGRADFAGPTRERRDRVPHRTVGVVEGRGSRSADGELLVPHERGRQL